MLDAPRVEAVINICVAAIAEHAEDDEGPPGAGARAGGGGGGGRFDRMSRAAKFIPDDCDDVATGEDQRRQRMFLQDPVYRADARAVLNERLEQFRGAAGEATFAQVMSQVEPLLLKQLQEG